MHTGCAAVVRVALKALTRRQKRAVPPEFYSTWWWEERHSRSGTPVGRVSLGKLEALLRVPHLHRKDAALLVTWASATRILLAGSPRALASLTSHSVRSTLHASDGHMLFNFAVRAAREFTESAAEAAATLPPQRPPEVAARRPGSAGLRGVLQLLSLIHI